MKVRSLTVKTDFRKGGLNAFQELELF